jgi:hypothetical protein
LSSIHLSCEKANLCKSDLDWDSYFNVALKKNSYPRQNILQKAKSFSHGLKNISAFKELNSLPELVSFMQFGSRGILSLLFPYISYEIYPKEHLSLFKSLLGLQEDSEVEFLKGFLKLWSKWGDTNFVNVLRTYNIELDKL